MLCACVTWTGQNTYICDKCAILPFFKEMELLGIPIPDVGLYIVTFWAQCVMS